MNYYADNETAPKKTVVFGSGSPSDMQDHELERSYGKNIIQTVPLKLVKKQRTVIYFAYVVK